MPLVVVAPVHGYGDRNGSRRDATIVTIGKTRPLGEAKPLAERADD
jgi:hypothetical protein